MNKKRAFATQAEYAAYIGTASDLDLYVQFEASSDGEVCLVNFAAPSCGNAELVHEDSLCCIDDALADPANPDAVLLSNQVGSDRVASG